MWFLLSSFFPQTWDPVFQMPELSFYVYVQLCFLLRSSCMKSSIQVPSPLTTMWISDTTYLCLIINRVFCTADITIICYHILFVFFYYSLSNGFLSLAPTVSYSSCLHLDMIPLFCVYVYTNNWYEFMLALLTIIWGPLSIIVSCALTWKNVQSFYSVWRISGNFLVHFVVGIST